MKLRRIARRRARRGSSSGQADVGTIVILACLAVAVFACFFLVGRAASPRVQAAEPPLPAVGAAVAGVPIRMSRAPAIATAISPRRNVLAARSTGTARAAVSPAAPAAAVVVAPPAPRPATVTPVKTGKPRRPGAPSSASGPGTSFDTSG